MYYCTVLLCLAFIFRRYLHDKQLFEDILNVVEQDPSANWYTGGNAPAMANRLAKEGCEVLLGARMSQKLRDSLHERIKGTAYMYCMVVIKCQTNFLKSKWFKFSQNINCTDCI